jgi:hypothetical protein
MARVIQRVEASSGRQPDHPDELMALGLRDAARQLGLLDVRALRRQLDHIAVAAPNLIARNPKLQTTLLAPLDDQKTLDAFSPFARSGWVIDLDDTLSDNQTGLDTVTQRILMPKNAWLNDTIMAALLPQVLAEARVAMTQSGFEQRYPHLEWDELSGGALKALHAWEQRGFDAGKHPGEASKAAKALGFASLDALQSAMQLAARERFVSQAEWERLGISAVPMQQALSALTPDRASVMRALIEEPLRSLQQPEWLGRAAGVRFTPVHLLRRVSKLTGLDRLGEPQKLSNTVTDATQKQAADLLEQLKPSASPALRARIDAALETLAQVPVPVQPLNTPPKPEPKPVVETPPEQRPPAVTAPTKPDPQLPAKSASPAAQAKPQPPVSAPLAEERATDLGTQPAANDVTTPEVPAVEPAAPQPGPEITVPVSAAEPVPDTPALTPRVQALPRDGVAATLLDVIDRAAEIAAALDLHSTSAAAGARVDLDVGEVMALALYRRAATLARKPDGSPDLKNPTLNNQYSEAIQKALAAYLTPHLGGKPTGTDVQKLAMSALRKLYRAEHPNNEFPNTFIARALISLDRMMGETGDAAGADPARASALAGIDGLVDAGALSTDDAKSVLQELGLYKPAPSPTDNAAWHADGERASGNGWALPREDIRDYPIQRQSAQHLAQERRQNADALVAALGAVAPTQAGAELPGSFLFNVALRALREGHASRVARLMDESWRSGAEPSAAHIRASLFSNLQAGPGYVNAVVNAYVDEVRDSIRFALGVRKQSGQADMRLTPIQATAALRLENKALDALTGGEPQRYLLSLPQASDNRQAALAALARLGQDEAFANGVVIWTTSKYLAEGTVHDEALAALGTLFEIVTKPDALADRIGADDRKQPLLAIVGDDALASGPALVRSLVERLGARGPHSRLVLVADEAQRLGADSKRSSALGPLAERADMTMALSATPVGRNAKTLGRLGQRLGLLPEGPLLSDPRAQYTAMAPHFMAGGAQRPKPAVEYLPVPYSEAGLSIRDSNQTEPGLSSTARRIFDDQLGIKEKLNLIAQRTAARVGLGGKVIIGSNYIDYGVRRVAERLARADTGGVRVGQLDGGTPTAERRETLRRFKLPASEPQALDALVMTFNAVRGDSAVDVNRPPAGGFEVIMANVPNTPAAMTALSSLVNQEALPETIAVRLTIPFMRLNAAQQESAGRGLITGDQRALEKLSDSESQAAGALGASSGRGVKEPMQWQLDRALLGRLRKGVSDGYFDDIGKVLAYKAATERGGAWQQASRYLQLRVEDAGSALRAQGRSPQLIDVGAGFNYLATRSQRSGSVDAAYGIDLMPASTIKQLVQMGELATGSDTQYIEGRIEDAPNLVAGRLGSGQRFNIATASFTLNGTEPAAIASYFRAVNAVLEVGDRFLIVHPLSSFDPQRRAEFERGLEQTGFEVVQDRQLDTVGAAIRYLELRRTGDPVRNVDVELFRLGGGAAR